MGLSVQDKFNTDFQESSHLGFPIRTILATFDLQVTLILPMKFQVSCLLVLDKIVQNRFSTWLLGNHLGFPIRMILAIFDLQVILILPVKF